MKTLFAALALAGLVTPTIANAAPRSTRAKSDTAHERDFVAKRPRADVPFPKTKSSDREGVSENAKLAYFTCRGGTSTPTAKSPEAAQKKCEESRKSAKDSGTKERCRCTGKDAIGVYGPYKYTELKKRRELIDHPFEGTDGQSYTRKGEGVTP